MFALNYIYFSSNWSYQPTCTARLRNWEKKAGHITLFLILILFQMKKNSSTPKKRGPVQKPTFDSDFVDDDDALMQVRFSYL